MNAVGQVKTAVARRLCSCGLDAVTEFEKERFTTRDTAVAAIGVRSESIAEAGLPDYLGERYDETAGTVREIYGRRMRLLLSLDVYAPRALGAEGCEAAAETAAEALLEPIDGLRMETLCWDEITWDKQYGMFLRRGTAEYTAFFAAEKTDDSAVLTDFILRGMVNG